MVNLLIAHVNQDIALVLLSKKIGKLLDFLKSYIKTSRGIHLQNYYLTMSLEEKLGNQTKLS